MEYIIEEILSISGYLCLYVLCQALLYSFHVHKLSACCDFCHNFHHMRVSMLISSSMFLNEGWGIESGGFTEESIGSYFLLPIILFVYKLYFLDSWTYLLKIFCTLIFWQRKQWSHLVFINERKIRLGNHWNCKQSTFIFYVVSVVEPRTFCRHYICWRDVLLHGVLWCVQKVVPGHCWNPCEHQFSPKVCINKLRYLFSIWVMVGWWCSTVPYEKRKFAASIVQLLFTICWRFNLIAYYSF